MFTKLFNWFSGWVRPNLQKERDHALNRARHKALYSKSGRVKPRQHDPRPPDRREQHK